MIFFSFPTIFSLTLSKSRFLDFNLVSCWLNLLFSWSLLFFKPLSLFCFLPFAVIRLAAELNFNENKSPTNSITSKLSSSSSRLSISSSSLFNSSSRSFTIFSKLSISFSIFIFSFSNFCKKQIFQIIS